MGKKKTTEAINREQEAMEEKEALPSFFTNLFSSASNPLPNRAVLEYNIMHSAPVLSLIHISEPTRLRRKSRMPSSA